MANEECLDWTGYCDPNGYGRVYWEGGSRLLSRVMWSLVIGPIPSGMNVCHTCDRPRCAAIGHLFLGTQAENLADMTAKGRRRSSTVRGETHPLAVLSDSTAEEIRRRYSGIYGEQRKLAREYGVSPSTIKGVINGYGRFARAA